MPAGACHAVTRYLLEAGLAVDRFSLHTACNGRSNGTQREGTWRSRITGLTWSSASKKGVVTKFQTADGDWSFARQPFHRPLLSGLAPGLHETPRHPLFRRPAKKIQHVHVDPYRPSWPDPEPSVWRSLRLSRNEQGAH